MKKSNSQEGATYVLRTRRGSERYVVATVEKYYDELIAAVSRNPNNRDGVVVCTTATEIPADAFRRITEVERVAQHPGATDEVDPKFIEGMLEGSSGETRR